MSAHAYLPPSGASAWVKCEGWAAMNERYPQDDTEATREGSASHWVGEQLIRDGVTGMVARASEFVNVEAPNGVLVSEEMVEAAELYAADVLAVCRSTGIFGGGNLGIETTLETGVVHPENWGTPDMWIYSQASNELYIWDYKYGHGFVDEFENWQLINYYALLATVLGIDGHIDQLTTVHFRVIQPRNYSSRGPIRNWSVTASDLRGQINQLANAAERAMRADPTHTSGAHCKYCPGRHTCEAAISGGFNLYEAAIGGHRDIEPAQVGTLLTLVKRAKEQLTALETGLEQEVEHAIRSGKPVPGWRHETTYGRQNWTATHEEVYQLGEIMGIDLRSEKPVTPKQSIQLGIDEEVIKDYSSTRTTGVKIIQDNDNRAKRVFNV